MRKIYYITILFCLIIFKSNAQNLVPNPSFEEYTVCPPGNSTNISYLPTGWNININSADYFNVCAPIYTQVSIPTNAWGFQYPYLGNAYCGFYGNTKTFTGNDARELFGCELLTPLQIQKKYYVSFEINLSNTSTCATNKIGILLTNNLYGDTIMNPNSIVNNFSHFYSTDIISDTNKWITVEGSFVADSSYNYLLIGNFYNSTYFDSISFNGDSFCGTYYYIDNVCISEDSLTCNNGTSVNYLSEYVPFNVYFNSIDNNLIIKSTLNCKANYDIYNDLGIIQQSGNFNLEPQSKINLNYLKTGVYIIKINYNNQIYIKRFLKL